MLNTNTIHKKNQHEFKFGIVTQGKFRSNLIYIHHISGLQTHKIICIKHMCLFNAKDTLIK